MTFELVQKIVATIIRTVENSAVMSVRALKAHTFSVRVSNQPSTQSIKGTVTVGNQKNIEKLLAKLAVAVAKLPTVYPETKIPSPLPYPKEISVSNLESVPQADLKRVEELLMKLVREMKALPKEYPKQEKFPTIPAFPKFPEFPKQLPFPSSMKVNVPTEIRVNNLGDAYEQVQELFEDLTGKDPKKHLNVRLSDGDEFYKAMLSVSGGGSRNITVTNLDPLIAYQVADKDTAGDPKYFGFTDKDELWYILRENVASGTYRYLSGGNNYDTAWTNRASHTYKYFHEVF